MGRGVQRRGRRDVGGWMSWEGGLDSCREEGGMFVFWRWKVAWEV